MPSFDIVNQTDMQEVDNAVNNVTKEIATRYDFRGTTTEVDFNRKEGRIHILTGDEMKLRAVRDMLISHFTRRKLDAKALDFKEHEPTSKGQLKQEVTLRQGIDKDTARALVKLIKGLKRKVQAAIQDDQVRVTGKKIDDLQEVISLVKESDIDIPLQFVNMK